MSTSGPTPGAPAATQTRRAATSYALKYPNGSPVRDGAGNDVIAHDLAEFVQMCDQHKHEAAEHLRAGHPVNWLRENGYPRQARMADHIHKHLEEKAKSGVPVDKDTKLAALNGFLGWMKKPENKDESGVDIEIIVTDDKGNPVPGLDITAREWHPAGPPDDCSKTFDKGAPGTYVLDVDPKSQWLIQVPPYANPTGSQVLTPNGNGRVLVTATQEFNTVAVTYGEATAETRITGTILHESKQGKTPVPFQGIPVELWADEHMVTSATTDALGRFALVFSGLQQQPGSPTKYYSVRLPSRQKVDSRVFTCPLPTFTVPLADGADLSVPQIVYILPQAEVVGQVTDGATSTGLAGATVGLVSLVTGEADKRTTNSEGVYRFTDVAKGKATLTYDQTFKDDSGAVWELTDSNGGQRTIDVSMPVTNVRDVVYQAEQHSIVWTVQDDQGKRLAGVLVELRDTKGNALYQGFTDDNGQVVFSNLQPDSYVVAVFGNRDLGADPLISNVTVNSTQTGITVIPRPPLAIPRGGGAAGSVTESLTDLSAYPLLTSDIGMGGGAAAPSPPAAGGNAPLGRVVESAIRDVLGWRPKPNDPKGFAAALNQAFTLKDVEGHTAWTWVQRGYAVQADMGAITGAQASIYERAKVALDQSLPLLDGLTPLIVTVAPEDQESIRAIVRSEFTEAVGELAMEGGPRVPRVDTLFTLLLGANPPTSVDPEKVGGQLGVLRTRYGLTRANVNTVEDEQNFTNFIVIVDYIASLFTSWQALKKYFVLGGGEQAPEPFFGTQLVLISRDFEVVAQSVQDVYFALDSVFLGAAERQTIELDFASLGTGVSNLFLGDLLDWVDRVASDEAPRLIQDAGKEGVNAVTGILLQLHDLVKAALVKPFNGNQDPGKLPPAYSTPRVQRALSELADSIEAAYQRAQPIKPPKIRP